MIFDGKTKREIAQMPDEEVSRAIQLELAEMGIPLTPKPPTEAVSDYLAKTEQGWKIKGIDIVFALEVAADDVRKTLRAYAKDLRQEKYEWSYGWDTRWLQQYEALDFEIERVDYYARELVQKNADGLAKRKNAKDAYDSEVKEFDKLNEERARIADGVWSQRYEAKKFIEKVDRVCASFPEYLHLCEGDRTRAMLFFEKAWRERVDVETWGEIQNVLLLQQVDVEQ